MRLTILGSGTIELHPSRGASCHLLETTDGARLLLDSGPGCLQRLVDRGLRPADIDAIVHSHLHLDHTADLFPLLFHHRSPGGRRARPLLLCGAPGHQDFLNAVSAALDPKLLSVPHEIREQESDGQAHAVGALGVSLAAWPANHSRSPRVVRLTGATPRPWAVAYSGDTGPCDGLIEAARGADWLLVECTNSERGGHSKHLGPEQIADVIRAAQPKATALIHLAPVWEHPEDAAAAVRRRVPGARVVGCEDGTVLELEPT
jgi:ribonuclease BN (tRNA processing enzyme)